MAILMARECADVSFVHLKGEEEDAEATKKEIEKASRKCNSVALDLRSNENCKKAVDEHIFRRSLGRSMCW